MYYHTEQAEYDQTRTSKSLNGMPTWKIDLIKTIICLQTLSLLSINIQVHKTFLYTSCNDFGKLLSLCNVHDLENKLSSYNFHFNVTKGLLPPKQQPHAITHLNNHYIALWRIRNGMKKETEKV